MGWPGQVTQRISRSFFSSRHLRLQVVPMSLRKILEKWPEWRTIRPMPLSTRLWTRSTIESCTSSWAMWPQQIKKQPRRSVGKSFAICIRNDGYEGSLDIGKVYVLLPDHKAAKYSRVRIVDNEGEGYLYPVEFFMPVELAKPAKQAASASAS